MTADLTSAATTPFYRIRWVLRLLRTTELPAHHAAVVYALLAQANGTSADAPAIPDGLMLDVPEQCRIRIEAGEEYAFGGTWIEPHPELLQERLHALNRRLRALGRQREHKSADGLGGNFELRTVEDLVRGRNLEYGPRPQPISADQITKEIRRLLPLEEITLRFTSPLRLERPRSDVHDGHHFFDHDYFHTASFLHRLTRRLPAIGIQRRDAPPEETAELEPDAATVIENRLVWLDLAYGRRDARRSLGGAVGRVRLCVTSELAKAALVWGQYARVGKNLHFGFGAYRIEELGPDLYLCRRATGLIELALRTPTLDRVAEQTGLPSGELRAAADAVLRGDYQPGPPTTFTIADKDGDQRQLSVPRPKDRALQRLLLERLGPALDKFFEVSSLAWRKGLGRHRAPERILRAYRDGYRFALREDFDRFFDSVDHRELADRLEAYLADDALVALLLGWVASGAPQPGRGLPTGAPLSPLLGNLLLDRFDEQIAALGSSSPVVLKPVA
jgi:CRISPR-associated protein Cas1